MSAVLPRAKSAIALFLCAALVAISTAACVTLEVGVEPVATMGIERTATVSATLPEPPDTVRLSATATATESPLSSPSPTRAGSIPVPTRVPVSLLAGLIYAVRDGLWQLDTDGEAVRLLDRPGALISPDGKVAMFDAAANKQDKLADIWVADLTTGEDRNLTFTPDRVEASYQWWPARPELIIMASESAGTINEPGLSGLLTSIGADGTGYRILDEQHPAGGQPALSPDGSVIAYGTGTVGWLYHMGTGTVAPFDPAEYGLTSFGELYIGNPAWSPDGRRLAWVINGRSAGKSGLQMGIAVFNLESRDAQLFHLYQPMGMDGFPPAPVWSPDGRWIAFMAAAQDPQAAGVWVARADGQAEEEIGLGLGSNPVWSPSGDMLALNLPTRDWRPATWIARVGTWVPELAELTPDAMLVDWRSSRHEARAPTSPANPIPLPTFSRRMKGYELYSWQEDGTWRFAFLVGTNRVKTYQEITEAPDRVEGIDALLEQIGRLPQGEQVSWLADRVPGMSLPPQHILQDVNVLCSHLGIQLEIVQSR